MKRAPKFVATKEQRALVMTLAGCGVPQKKIRLVVKNAQDRPVSLVTLQNHFRHELDCGVVAVQAVVAKGILKAAERGNPAVLIFLAKTRLGFKEISGLELTGDGGGPVKVEDARGRLARRIASTPAAGGTEQNPAGDEPS